MAVADQREDLRDSFGELIEISMWHPGLPRRQVRPVEQPKCQRRIDGVEKRRNQNASTLPLRRFVSHPFRGNGRPRPQHDHAPGCADRLLNDLVKRSAQWNFLVPPDRPATQLQAFRERLRARAVLGRIAEEDVGHSFSRDGSGNQVNESIGTLTQCYWTMRALVWKRR